MADCQNLGSELTALPDVLVYTTSDILLLQEVFLECTEATTLLAPELHWQSFGMVYNVSSLERYLFLLLLPYRCLLILRRIDHNEILWVLAGLD
jgi:hypothetical protein